MIDHKVMGMIANWVICTVGGIVVIATLYIYVSACYIYGQLISQLDIYIPAREPMQDNCFSVSDYYSLI